MPPQRWPTEFHYVDGGLDQADATDFVCVNRIIAEPWRQCFAVPPVDIEESESEDPLTEEEWDLVQGYMDQPFHDWGNQREGRVVADLGVSALALDALSSGTSAHLRVWEKYWSAQDSAWKKHWGPHQGLMWIHCPRWDIPRAIAKICKDRSKAVLVVPMGCTEEESTRHWVASLTNMTLNKVVLPAGESVYQDARGQPMPPQRWPAEFHYVDGGLDQADATDFVCVNRIIAEPWRQCFAVPPVDIEESESEDPLTEEEWDLVQGYMDQPFHDWGNQREGKGQDKAWWEVDSIVSGSYDGNTFVQRVLDHLSSQDEPIGGNPPTYGDLFRGKTRDGPLGPPGKTARAEDELSSYPSSKLRGSSARKSQGGVRRLPQDSGIEGQAEAEVW